MALKKFSSEEILQTEIGWCEPWIFEFEDNKLTNLEIKTRPGSKSMNDLIVNKSDALADSNERFVVESTSTFELTPQILLKYQELKI